MRYLPFREYGKTLGALTGISVILGAPPGVFAFISGRESLFLIPLLGSLGVAIGLVLDVHTIPMVRNHESDSPWVTRALSSIKESKVVRYSTWLSIGALASLPFVAGVFLESAVLVYSWVISGCLLGLLPNERTPTETTTDTGGGPMDGSDGKNVIFYMIDDIRRDRMSLYGYDRETTPFLEGIADDALVFDNHISAGTRSGTSIPSLLTGVPGSVHEFGRNTDLRTVMDEFAGRGYRTAGINTNGHLPPDSWGKFFDYYLYLPNKYSLSLPPIYLVTTVLDRLGVRYRSNRDLHTEDTATMNEMAKGFIQEASTKEEPYFLFMGSIEAHEPYVRDPGAIVDFADRHGEALDFHSGVNKDRSIRRAEWHSDRLKQWGYDEMVHYTDQQLKDLVEFLESNGELEDTTLVVLSDHGELLGEHDMWGHLDMQVNPPL
jgi:hypothetical protein